MTAPKYLKNRESGVIVNFTGAKEGYVIEQGNSSHKVGSLHKDWIPYDHPSWEPYYYEDSEITSCKTPDQLELFESLTIQIGRLKDSTITKVPNGYVMTSHSGHQLFIKDLLKETL